VSDALSPGVALLTLGEGAERRHVDEALLGQLLERHAALDRDPEVRVIVLTSRGRVFALGADLDAMSGMGDAARDAYLRRGQALSAALRQSRALTIAALNGLAFGGGLELALACDVRWAHRRAAFELPECKRGVLPAWGATRLLQGVLAGSLAMELLCGRRLTAFEALQAGLVSRIFEGPQFDQDVLAAAGTLSREGGESLRAIVELWRHAGSTEEHAAAERRLFDARWRARAAG
jgi:enoyl-CoA hydratase/carnithine racemase